MIRRKPTLYNDGTTATMLRHAICCAMCNASSRPHRYSANYSLLRNNACTNYVSATHCFCSYIMTREQHCTERTLTRMGRSKVGSRLYRIFLRKPLRWSEFFGVQSKTRELRTLTWALSSCARKSLNGLKRNNFSVRTAIASCQARNR